MKQGKKNSGLEKLGILSVLVFLYLIIQLLLSGCSPEDKPNSQPAPTGDPIPSVCLIFSPGREHENATDYSECLKAPDAWYEANAILTASSAATASAEAMLPPPATPAPSPTPQLIVCGYIGTHGGVIYDVARNVVGYYPWGGLMLSGTYIGVFDGSMRVFSEGEELPVVHDGNAICFSGNREALQNHIPTR